MPDAAIIGAGPAGSLAGLILARAGWDVILIEQHRFPRDKVCGECLSATGLEVMSRAGLIPLLRSAGAVDLHSSILNSPGGNHAMTALPRPMLGLSRHALDGLLLDAARSAGVKILQPARCEAIHAGGSAVSARIRDLECNALLDVTASVVLIADGKSALLEPGPPSTGDIGIKTHFSGVADVGGAIELFGCAGCYGGLAPIESGRCNAAFSIPAERIRRHRGNIDALFAELRRENAALDRRLAGAEQVMDWLAAPLPRFAVRSNWPSRIIPLGNAAAAIEPIGGEGMGLALASAELAAHALKKMRGDWSSQNAADLRREFSRLWNRRRFFCRLAARIVCSPALCDMAIDWMNASEQLSRVVLQAMGK